MSLHLLIAIANSHLLQFVTILRDFHSHVPPHSPNTSRMFVGLSSGAGGSVEETIVTVVPSCTRTLHGRPNTFGSQSSTTRCHLLREALGADADGSYRVQVQIHLALKAVCQVLFLPIDTPLTYHTLYLECSIRPSLIIGNPPVGTTLIVSC